MNLNNFSISGKPTFPHEARQLAKNLGYGDKNLYENLDMQSHYIACTYDILYSSDTVPVHTHTFYEIAFCDSGYAKYLAEKQFFSIRPGNITIIPPGIRHCPNGLQNMTQPFKRILFCINPALMEKIISTGPYYEKHKALFSHARHFHTLGTPYEKLGKYFHMANIETDIENPYCESYLTGILTCLLTKLMEATDTSLSPTMKVQKETLENIISYIEKHLTEKITLNDITAHFHISKNSINKMFLNTLGCSFHDYIIEARLDEAKNMLQKNVNLDTVAEDTGFGDYSNFYRTFKKKYNMTPSEYRTNLTLLNSIYLKIEE